MSSEGWKGELFRSVAQIIRRIVGAPVPYKSWSGEVRREDLVDPAPDAVQGARNHVFMYAESLE